MKADKAVSTILLHKRLQGDIIAQINELAALRKISATAAISEVLRDVLPDRVTAARERVK